MVNGVYYRIPEIAVLGGLECGHVEIVHVIHRVAALQDIDLPKTADYAEVHSYPVPCPLTVGRGIESGGVIVEHQLAADSSGVGIRAYGSIGEGAAAGYTAVEAVEHVVHGILVEGLELEST